ncbi:MAG: glycosyltransferase family 4 protein [Candidatus Thermoplasmatota archaeon]|nr:glycosyltransferase family 4 protein [Candidatus Thermoplasmatota archaeon]
MAMLTYSTRPRGGVVHALKLAERLGALGADVSLHSVARAGDAESLRGYFREVSVPFNIYQYQWSHDMIERLENMIESYISNLPRDADIYHAQDCVGGTSLWRMKAAGTISAPTFRTVHHVDDFAHPQLFEFEKKAVANAEHRFVVSRYWRDALKTDFGYESEIAYNGIDIGDFVDLPERRSSDPTLLFVGGFEPRKGLDRLVQAMPLIAEEVPDVRLIVVAKSGFRGTDQVGTFTSLARRLGVEGRILFRESVDQRTLLSFYSNCDVVVLPSRNEGWGLSLMEAMACGRPVVATRVGGIPELVRDGVDGLLVDPDDLQQLSLAVTRLLRNPDLRDSMARAGRERVKAFSWDDTAKVVLAAYESALAR